MRRGIGAAPENAVLLEGPAECLRGLEYQPEDQEARFARPAVVRVLAEPVEVCEAALESAR